MGKRLRMKTQTSRRMKTRKSRRMKARKSRRMNKRTSRRMNKWTSRRMKTRTSIRGGSAISGSTQGAISGSRQEAVEATQKEVETYLNKMTDEYYKQWWSVSKFSFVLSLKEKTEIKHILYKIFENGIIHIEGLQFNNIDEFLVHKIYSDIIANKPMNDHVILVVLKAMNNILRTDLSLIHI
mgnify:FL=1